ncbi:MAG: hypothetical protein ACYC6L_04720 [Anaerolineae bacterium]
METLKLGELFRLLRPKILGLLREQGGLYHELTTPSVHTSWDGDGKTSTDNGNLDINTLWGIPSTARVIHVQMTLGSNTAGKYANLGYSSESGKTSFVGQIIQSTSYTIVAIGNVTVNGGNVYFSCNGADGATVTVYIRVLGYYI